MILFVIVDGSSETEREVTRPKPTEIEAWLAWVGCLDQSVEDFHKRVKLTKSNGFFAKPKNYGDIPV